MSSFELIGKHPTNKKIDKTEIISLVKKSLLKNYEEKTIEINSNGLLVTGFTKGFFEHAYTKAKIEIIVNENEVIYHGHGTVTSGPFPWFKILLGFIPSLQFFWAWVIFNWIDFLISKEKPRQYFDDALKSIEWMNYSQESNSFKQSSLVVENNQIENKSSDLKNILAGSEIQKKPAFSLDFDKELFPLFEGYRKDGKIEIEVSPNINKSSLLSAIEISCFPDFDKVTALLRPSSKKDAFLFGTFGIYYFDSLGEDAFPSKIFYEDFLNRSFKKKGWFDIDLDKGKFFSASSFEIDRGKMIALLNDIQVLCQSKL